jgi:hypothetical protein
MGSRGGRRKEGRKEQSPVLFSSEGERDLDIVRALIARQRFVHVALCESHQADIELY